MGHRPIINPDSPYVGASVASRDPEAVLLHHPGVAHLLSTDDRESDESGDSRPAERKSGFNPSAESTPEGVVVA
jgi:hypothetical protein